MNPPVERSFPAPALTCGKIYHIRQIKYTVKVGSVLVGITISRRAENESGINVIFGYGKPRQEETGTTTTCSENYGIAQKALLPKSPHLNKNMYVFQVERFDRLH